ncbi:ABC transporter permease [Nitratireductor sp. ZSWI3]|uniref:ABC transporter permease n=1 Tax=Nitratireductor sp. ZSWI3 TaxID=2966359 RepID=UPI00214FF9C8|nr:ABC transporter permease [Nitratireductor sp. ZSWI3]MCR4268128.1 ABC transporter permease [Nitratireductor sp. ZSWI3]
MSIVNEIPDKAAGGSLRELLPSSRIVAPIAVLAAILLVWQTGVRYFDVKPFIAPAPTDVLAVLVSDYPLLLRNFWPTLSEALLGFAVGNIIAVLIAVAFVHNRAVEKAFFPVAVFVNTIPILAIAPILVLIFGNGMTAKVVIAALICFFPTLVNMVKGLQSVGKDALDLAQILSATKNEVFWKIRLPASLPYLFAALKIAATTSVIGAIVGEWIGADVGLGALIIDATFNFRSPLLYATVFVSSGLAVLLFLMVTLLERRLVYWTANPRH